MPSNRSLEFFRKTFHGMIGREGVVGASIANYGKQSFGKATVQIAGLALRMRSDAFLKIYGASERFRRAVNASQAVIFLQAQQSAAYHALHTVEERLCRWLLQSQDVIEFGRHSADAGISVSHAGRAA